jgi:hypothetical protein
MQTGENGILTDVSPSSSTSGEIRNFLEIWNFWEIWNYGEIRNLGKFGIFDGTTIFSLVPSCSKHIALYSSAKGKAMLSGCDGRKMKFLSCAKSD